MTADQDKMRSLAALAIVVKEKRATLDVLLDARAKMRDLLAAMEEDVTVADREFKDAKGDLYEEAVR